MADSGQRLRANCSERFVLQHGSALRAASRYFSTSSGRSIHFYDWGEGPLTCYLLHGLGEGGHVWDDFCGRLPPGLRVIAPDLPGHGKSPWSADGRYTVYGFADLILRLVASEGRGPVVIVGHSLGADVAIRVTALLEKRVLGLALVDFGPALIQEGVKFTHDQFREQFRPYRCLEEYGLLLEKLRPLASVPLLREFAAKSVMPVDDAFALRCDSRLSDAVFAPDTPRLWQLLRELRVPILVLRGGGSAVLSPSVAQQMTVVARAAQYRQISRAGHGVMLDNPDEFAAATLDFIRSLRC